MCWVAVDRRMDSSKWVGDAAAHGHQSKVTDSQLPAIVGTRSLSLNFERYQ